ncbi:MAG: Short-chain dehydrogenase/reductase [Herbinix sp.]|jgi:NADP-dependent 3-hydroxy acid dehydrogenase YdfG|nr:Short-chain dehydrogenase/reductase [Herbinix sp.]
MKYAFFTGATGGLGVLCVSALSKTGNWTIFAAGNNESVLKQLEKLPNIIPIKVDITKQESVDNAYEVVQTYTSTLDAIINFAGLTYFTSLIEGESINAVERLLDVNVVGMARINRTFFEMIYKGKGRIINCSSESGWMTPQPFAGPYILSKYAVEAYNDSLRRELLYLGIPVIKIQPGSYETNITQQVNHFFDKAVSETTYYKELLLKMKPMMTMELNQKNDPRHLVNTVIKALESKNPKMKYRVGTGKLLAMLELLPEWGVDAVYKRFFR